MKRESGMKTNKHSPVLLLALVVQVSNSRAKGLKLQSPVALPRDKTSEDFITTVGRNLMPHVRVCGNIDLGCVWR